MFLRPTPFLALAAALLVAAPLAAQAPEQRSRATLGVEVVPAQPGGDQAGVVVSQVRPDSPAAKAGIKRGDVIVKAGDHDVRGVPDLAEFVARHQPGDKVTLGLRRDGKDEKLTVTLAERRVRATPGREPARRGGAFLGVGAEAITPALRDQFNLQADKGVVVVEVLPDSPADKAGLKHGDVIMSVNGKDVNDAAQLRAAVRDAGVGKKVTLKVRRGTETHTFAATLEEVPAEPSFEFPRITPPRVPIPSLPGFAGEDHRRVEELERQVKELQRRVDELEKRAGKTK